MLNILFTASQDRWAQYKIPLHTAFDKLGIPVTIATDCSRKDVDYIIYAPNSDLSDFTPFPKLKAVLNLWAGVEDVVQNKTLMVPLVRMIDSGLTQGMVEYVTGHVMRYHLGMDAHLLGQDGIWRDAIAPLANNRKITILGLGALGKACAEMLALLGFNVVGWSRTSKFINGVTNFHGTKGLQKALAHGEILVVLLPLTQETNNLISDSALAQIPKGAYLINPARGAIIDEAALLNAIKADHIRHATLDAFTQEPLPRNHPFWDNPAITVTPHIASVTRPKSAAQTIAENIQRCEDHQPMIGVVNRAIGY